MTTIKRRLETMGTKLTERDLMIHILGTLPKAYKTTVDLAEKDLMAGSLTIEGLKELLRTKFEKLKGSNNNDFALFTKQFKGACKVCRKIGHKGEDCFKLEKTSKKKKNMKNETTTNKMEGRNQFSATGANNMATTKGSVPRRTRVTLRRQTTMTTMR